MARPVNPKAVRRLGEGAPVEVLTAAGLWMELAFLSDTSVNNVTTKVAENGLPPMFPSGRFDWQLADMPKPKPQQEQVPSEPMVVDDEYDDDEDDELEVDMSTDDESDDDESDDDESDDDSEDESDDDEDEDETPPAPQQQQQQSPMQMMMEDIVRKIAGELDQQQQQLIDQQFASVQSLVDEAVKNIHPTDGPNTRIVPVTTQVVVTTPTTTVTKDGLFHNQFDDLMGNILAGVHTALPGPPGSGKSHSAEQAANILGWPFGAISLGPTTPESRLWGGMDANGRFFEPPLIKLIRHAMENPDSGAVFCFDEADNAHAGIIATTNSAKANGWVYAPNGDLLTLGSNMVFIMAMNTFGTGPTAEFAGRNKLDPATLDRYSYIPWDTDYGMEEVLVRQRIADPMVASAWLDAWRTLRANVETHGLKFFVTMRGAINGAKIIAAGRPLEKAMMLVAGNKLPADQWRKVSPL